jgi:hypothetical protein
MSRTAVAHTKDSNPMLLPYVLYEKSSTLSVPRLELFNYPVPNTCEVVAPSSKVSI